MNLAAETLTLQLSGLDIALLVIYFGFVIGIGFALRRLVTTSADFFLSGRSLPAWVTGIAFICANLGAIEILGMAASGAQYGISIVHYYWIGAVPAMIFLGVVMMPFYYGSKVRSVPEYLVRRYDHKTHLVNAIIFVLSSILIAGVNLYALAAVLDVLLGIPLPIAIVVSALFVLSYILLGGLTSAIYNEVMQFFVICAGLIPIVIVALTEAGGHRRPLQKLSVNGPNFTHPWAGSRLRWRQPVRRLGRAGLRPRVLPVVRILDDQLRRGAAGDVGQGPQLRPADPDHRFVPEGHHSVRHRHPGHGRGAAAPGDRRVRRTALQRCHPRADEQVPAHRRARRGHHRPARRVHGGHGGQRLLVQRGVDLRHLAGLHPARPSGPATTCGSAASPPSPASSSASAPRSSRRATATSTTTSRRSSRSSTCRSSWRSSSACSGRRPAAAPGSGG